MSRKDDIAVAGKQHFDVVVVGGGITGAGIFLKCCNSGLKTILIDRDDFAAGTSCRSAKMIHGGLRYLEYLQVKLVKEALEERENLLQLFPHIVKPLPFLMPIYDSRVTKMKIRIGLTGYDALAGNSSLPKHATLSKEDIIRDYPMLKKKGLKGGFFYYDAITNDARLTNEVIMQGRQAGGIALNYVAAEELNSETDKVSSISCADSLDGSSFEISADYFISATGIWTDEFLGNLNTAGNPVMNPSKGVHVVVSGQHFPNRDVLLIPCEDKRFIWLCPWVDNLVIIGATDTIFEGDLREPGTTEEDVQYLLRNANNYLEGIELTENDILSVYSGLRPLLSEEGEDNTVKMSRDYKVWWQQQNLMVIAGGKLTSFLSMADKVVNTLKERADFDFEKLKDNEKGTFAKDNSPLRMEWGENAKIVNDIASESPQNHEKIADHLDYTLAGLRYFIRHQHVQKISDVLTRRMSVTYSMQPYNDKLVTQVAEVMQQELGWTDDTKSNRISDFEKHWNLMHSWTK